MRTLPLGLEFSELLVSHMRLSLCFLPHWASDNSPGFWSVKASRVDKSLFFTHVKQHAVLNLTNAHRVLKAEN